MEDGKKRRSQLESEYFNEPWFRKYDDTIGHVDYEAVEDSVRKLLASGKYDDFARTGTMPKDIDQETEYLLSYAEDTGMDKDYMKEKSSTTKTDAAPKSEDRTLRNNALRIIYDGKYKKYFDPDAYDTDNMGSWDVPEEDKAALKYAIDNNLDNENTELSSDDMNYLDSLRVPETSGVEDPSTDTPEASESYADKSASERLMLDTKAKDSEPSGNNDKKQNAIKSFLSGELFRRGLKK